MNYALSIVTLGLVTLASLGWFDRWLRKKGQKLWVRCVVFVGSFCIVGMGVLLTELTVAKLQRETGERLMEYAKCYASEVELLGHERIEPGKVEQETYLKIIEAEKRWTTLNYLVSDIYTLRRGPAGFILNVDSETDYDRNGIYDGEREQRTVVGEPFGGVISKFIAGAFEGRAVFVAEPYTDRWGVWVSAFVPLRNSFGKVDAVLGVDFPAEDWHRQSWDVRFLAAGTVSALLLAIVTAVLMAVNQQAATGLLRERENRMAVERDHEAVDRLVASIDGVIWAWNIDTRRFAYVSPRIESMFGYPVAAWYDDGTFWRAHIHPDDSWATCHLDELSGARGPFAVEYRMIARDGRVIWIHEAGQVSESMDPQGHRVARGWIRDTTAEKEALAQLDKAHLLNLEQSRRAGMAEVATGVLHNVGNVLNSVNVSGNLILDRIRHSRVSELVRVAELVREHSECLTEFVEEDQRGRMLPQLLDAIAAQLVTEHQEISNEIEEIADRIGHIKGIVSVQQSHARTSGNVEPRNLVELIEGALKLNEHYIRRARVRVVRDYDDHCPLALCDGHRMLQIFVNLIKNAVDAIEAARIEAPRITLSVRYSPDMRMLCASVKDNGMGISPEHLQKIFSHGFTTKKNGHGFGLHSAAIAATEMGGRIDVTSAGHGGGATFTVTIPKAELIRSLQVEDSQNSHPDAHERISS